MASYLAFIRKMAPSIAIMMVLIGQAHARDFCWAYPGVDATRGVKGVTIYPEQFRRVMWYWRLARTAMRHKAYRGANQELLRAMGALGTCSKYEIVEDDSVFHEMEADDVEKKGKSEMAARIRMGLLESYFGDCMEDFLRQTENRDPPQGAESQ
ncbi:hypothetical protein [Nitrospirillum amazonense]|uniref:hypothetical protein n=1 Tax=Nitrospirillum amazonense TaxID=28077 RepID=UPI00119CD285|nr:hypothetical protein [Nitrospirillum amazonense]MDG3441727.1 hypothetical protein [Nitrospirillum amazonense]